MKRVLISDNEERKSSIMVKYGDQIVDILSKELFCSKNNINQLSINLIMTKVLASCSGTIFAKKLKIFLSLLVRLFTFQIIRKMQTQKLQECFAQ